MAPAAVSGGAAAVVQQAEWARRLFARMYPEYLRVGPYHPAAKALLCAYAALLLGTSRAALRGGRGPDDEGSDDECPKATPLLRAASARAVRLAGAAWGLAVLAWTYRSQGGAWPLDHRTMQSWTLMTFRYVAGLLAEPPIDAPSAGPLRRALLWAYEALRFPALAQNSVTVAVWWTVMVPVCTVALRRQGKGSLASFWRFNASPLLINVHLLNLPLAAAEHLAHPRRLSFRDLWMGMAAAGLYLSFYLRLLDARGLHLYIFLSPRTKLFGLAGAASLGMYAAL
ncbi:unnamed protein product, partial [Prorocentrum cordatum]